MNWEVITVGIKDLIYIVFGLGGLISAYHILKNRISSNEKDIITMQKNIEKIEESEVSKEQAIKSLGEKIFNKIECLIQQITDSNTLLKEHISYHKGMEDAEHKNK
jgi:hypothetical protein